MCRNDKNILVIAEVVYVDLSSFLSNDTNLFKGSTSSSQCRVICKKVITALFWKINQMHN